MAVMMRTGRQKYVHMIWHYHPCMQAVAAAVKKQQLSFLKETALILPALCLESGLEVI